jgi:hypothetical protein
MTRRLRSDSVTAESNNFRAGVSIPVPNGIELDSEDEKILWGQFTKTRAAADWRDFDLVLLAKIVKLEANMRRHQAMIDKSGPLITNKRGTLVENPLLRVVDTLQRQQLALIRSMSLNQTESDPRTLNAAGKRQQETAQMIQDVGLDSLIAMPTSIN